MYLPAQHAWIDRSSIVAFCRAHPFATLVSQGTAGPEAQHIPLLIDPAENGDGLVLHGHAALGNPLWQASTALAIFHGPHAYVSAAWYDEDDTVPTWNYLAVHAGGDLRVINDPNLVQALFTRLGATDPEAEVWRRRLSHEALGRMSQAIRWFRIDAVQVQAKAKLSQHHPPGRQQRVIQRLLASDDPAAQAVGLAMHRTLTGGLPWEASPGLTPVVPPDDHRKSPEAT